ncbi:hypothetical protein L1887_40012 [Cichorium endivia]|nr:hypothetical protein L1887_40012 [Cichorium endivia]
MVIASYFLLLFIPCAASITFSFTKIGPQNQYRDINTTGSAYITNDGIQVTPNEIDSNRNQTAGRAIYFQPLHLWDKSSGELASFTTDFTFVIDSKSFPDFGDGLTFLMTGDNSMIINGSSMGLPINGYTNVKNQFIAVEFDTFPNRNWDPVDSKGVPLGTHIGIDINSLASVAYQKWRHNITGGRVSHAWISYDSVSKNLSASVTGFINNTVVIQAINHTVDLRRELPEWVVFGFSAATGAFFEKNMVISWAFNSSDLKVDKNNAPPRTRSPDLVKEKKKPRLPVILSVVLSVPITLVAVLVFFLWRKKKKSNEEEQGLHVEMNNDFEMGTGPRRFSYRELARSTGDFAENKKLGEGGFGGVYKGFLKELGLHVAVKRVSKSSRQGIKEYASEVTIISKLRHRNLVQLTGWCHEKGELLLIYEFMENGSLDTHLFKGKSLLAWETRYKIANGLASALLYLHEEWEQCVLHRDIKSSNVMLDSNFNAKLGDFGLAKLVDHEKGTHTTMLAGTFGYMAPEYAVSGRASKESDVFSFGVVALEIACGRKPILHNAQENEIHLVEWVWESYGSGTLLEVVDPRLGLDYEEEEIKRLMIIGLWCVHPDSLHRPSMRQVIQVMNSEAPLPILPSTMPVATYMFSPMSSSFGGDFSIDNLSSRSTTYMGHSSSSTLYTGRS